MNTILKYIPIHTTHMLDAEEDLSVFTDKIKDSAETQLPQRDCLSGLIHSLTECRYKKIYKKPATGQKSRKWSTIEISKMLELMSILGTDFSIVAIHLQSKTRDQIKRKFSQLQSTRY
jgi:hypothetical protein